jgi:ribonuclease T1
MRSIRRQRPLREAASILVAVATMFLVAVATLLGGGVAVARSVPDELGTVALADLPQEAREVYALVGRGGPFAYDRDGVVFGNREGLLPAMPRGYYHEYTVRTPGVKTRGARRMVCGGPAKAPEACYYTDDHYQSFRRIRE